MIIFDADDFGANHEISDICQSHDCRDVLIQFKEANPAFKATLFAIPGEMTLELLGWCDDTDWIELAQHGFYHGSNYECEKLGYQEFALLMDDIGWITQEFFVKGFKAPGWQISSDIYHWLKHNDWWVADQEYNDMRRPIGLKTYKIGENSMHHHTWNCVGNGVYEQFDYIMDRIKDETEFKFVSEVV